jgi:hypothetical protein
MTASCLPPANTPAGTVCVLTNIKRPYPEARWPWRDGKWVDPDYPANTLTPEAMAMYGWRFVRIQGATPR